MRWRVGHTRFLSALTVLLLAVGIWHAAVADPDGDPARAAARPDDGAGARSSAARTVPRTAARPVDPAGTRPLGVTVGGTPAGLPLPAPFLGLSFEYSALKAYAGSDPASLDPVFVQLLRNLAPAPGQPMVLRIGGNSTDVTWWPVKRQARPAGVTYALTPAWLAEARALAQAASARLILGVNLAAARPELAAAEADALLRGIGAGHVAALEIGNEPDVYGVFPWYSGPHGQVFARAAGYSLSAFIAQLARWDTALPDAPLAGPAFAELPWMAGLPTLLKAAPHMQIVTVHRYPLQGCLTNPGSPAYPSIANLLSNRSSAGMAQALARYVAMAHARGLRFRVDELNSAALAGCLERTGVSNTFASALWMLDTLFNLASVGVDGVNVHSLPGAGYEPFTISRGASGWQAFVHPDYYGMLMFAQAFPPGARLLPVHAADGLVKVWATRGADGRTRVVLINEDARAHRVALQLPVGVGRAEVEWLRAPGAGATAGVTLGGQTFGPETTTGRLAAPQLQPVARVLGSYSIELPAYSAALMIR